jgi:alpha-glucosidase
MEQLLPPGGQPTYVLSSHDAPRYRTRFDDALWGEARARVAVMMLLTLRGTPFLYYGEEIGMRDGVVPPERICDPVGQRFPGLGRDPERTPMQWTGEPGAGFSTAAEPWLPLGSDAPAVNVARQVRDPRSHLSFYRQLIWFRKGAPALTRGTYRPIDAPADTFVYLREHAGQRLLVALNFASEARRVALPSNGRSVLSTDARHQPGAPVTSHLELGPVEGVVLELSR